MQAAVFEGDKRITIGDLERPKPAAGEVLLRVRRTALCGSDTKLWLKGAQFTPGHEIFGVVEQPGHALHGRRCLVYIPVHCGHCASCLAGDTQMCLNESVLVGWNRPGGYAEYLTVPEQCLLEVPDDIDDDLAPLLLDTIGTAAHGIRFVMPLVPPAETGPVLVTGAGPVGMGAIVALQNLGYPDVRVSDLKEERLQLAESFGARRHPVGDARQAFQADRRMQRIACGTLARHGDRAAARRADPDRRERHCRGRCRRTKAIRRKDFYMVRTFYFPEARVLSAQRGTACARRRRATGGWSTRSFGIDELPEMFRPLRRGRTGQALAGLRLGVRARHGIDSH